MEKKAGGSKKGRIISFVVMIILIVVTLYLLFTKYDFNEILAALGETKPGFIVAAFFAAFVYVMLEGISLRTITNSLGEKRSHVKGFVFASVDLYFSAITPSSEGGQPLMIYTMNRDGISISKSTITAVLFTNMFTSGLLICTIIAAILRPDIFLFQDTLFRICLIVGIVISLLIFVGCILLLRFGHAMRRLGMGVIGLLCKIRLIKKREKYEAKLDAAIEDFSECEAYIKSHPLLTLKVLICAFLQRVVFFTIPYLIYLSFGIGSASFTDVFALQVFVQMAVYALPIPGSAGVTELVLTRLYTAFLYETEAQIASATLLTRAVTFYFVVIVCGIVTLVNNVVTNKKAKDLELL